MEHTPLRSNVAELLQTPEKITKSEFAAPACAEPCKMLLAPEGITHDHGPHRARQLSIVLTGGPCSGKSSVLALIRERLSKRGIQVITVPEYATHFFANSDGFQLEWVGAQQEKDLQHVFLRYQMMQEDLFRDYAFLNSKISVVLLDRGTLDQKVFTSSDEIWNDALTRCVTTEHELLDRYDMVMHLATCAKVGNYEWGADSNNPGRYHCPDEAARLDGVFKEVYKEHKQFRTVPHCAKFEDKVNLVMRYLEDALGVDGLVGKRGRVAVELVDQLPADVLQNSHAFVASSVYLEESIQHSIRRILKTTGEVWQSGRVGNPHDFVPSSSQAGFTDHQRVYEERRSIPEESSLARRSISEDAYHAAVRATSKRSIHKYVLGFCDEAGVHHELFYFLHNQQLILDHPMGHTLPAWLKIAAERNPTCSQLGKRTRVLRKHSTEEASETHMMNLQRAT